MEFVVKDPACYIHARRDRLNIKPISTQNVFAAAENANWSMPPMTAADLPSPYVITASSVYGDAYAGWKAFDGNAGTYWNVVAGGPAAGSWVKVDSGGLKIALTACTIKNYTNQGFNAFKLRGSHNDLDWDDIYSGNCANNNTVQAFSFPNAHDYRYHMVYCVSGYNSNNLGAYEISLSGIYVSAKNYLHARRDRMDIRGVSTQNQLK